MRNKQKNEQQNGEKRGHKGDERWVRKKKGGRKLFKRMVEDWKKKRQKDRKNITSSKGAEQEWRKAKENDQNY